MAVPVSASFPVSMPWSVDFVGNLLVGSATLLVLFPHLCLVKPCPHSHRIHSPCRRLPHGAFSCCLWPQMLFLLHCGLQIPPKGCVVSPSLQLGATGRWWEGVNGGGSLPTPGLCLGGLLCPPILLLYPHSPCSVAICLSFVHKVHLLKCTSRRPKQWSQVLMG